MQHFLKSGRNIENSEYSVNLSTVQQIFPLHCVARLQFFSRGGKAIIGKQTDAAAVNKQISIQKDSTPSEFTRPLTSFTL